MNFVTFWCLGNEKFRVSEILSDFIFGFFCFRCSMFNVWCLFVQKVQLFNMTEHHIHRTHSLTGTDNNGLKWWVCTFIPNDRSNIVLWISGFQHKKQTKLFAQKISQKKILYNWIESKIEFFHLSKPFCMKQTSYFLFGWHPCVT